jgi:hypothetical protein
MAVVVFASAQAKPVLERDGLVSCTDLPSAFCG